MARTRPRRVQKGNPQRLTIQQHVLPRRSIARFNGADHKVEVRRQGHTGTLRLNANNPMFCAMRVWDQRAESGFSRSIEVDFQRLADAIVAGTTTLDSKDHQIISKFWALWRLRAEVRANPAPPLELKGVLEAKEFSIEEKEVLESKHVAFAENGNQIPSHIWSGLRMQIQIDRLITPGNCWGIVHCPAGEFVVPAEIGALGYVPLTPSLALLANQPNATISREECRRLNDLLLKSAGAYFFGRSLHTALSESAT